MLRGAHEGTQKHQIVDPSSARPPINDRLHEHSRTGRVTQRKDRCRGLDDRYRRFERFDVVREIPHVRALTFRKAMAGKVKQHDVEAAIKGPFDLVTPQCAVLEETMKTYERAAPSRDGEALQQDSLSAHLDAPDFVERAIRRRQTVV